MMINEASPLSKLIVNRLAKPVITINKPIQAFKILIKVAFSHPQIFPSPSSLIAVPF